MFDRVLHLRKWWPLKARRISVRKYNIIKNIGKCKLPAISSMAGVGAERQFNLPPALSVYARCWFNVVLTSSSLFIMPHAHSHHAVIEHHPRRTISRAYMTTRLYIIKKRPERTAARFIPERLAGCAQSARLFDDLAWKIAFRLNKATQKKHITFCASWTVYIKQLKPMKIITIINSWKVLSIKVEN